MHLSKLEKIAIGFSLFGQILIGTESYAKEHHNTDLSKNQTEANQFIQEFPEEMPGIAKVYKCIVPDAKKVIIHIQQPHELNPEAYENKDTYDEYLTHLISLGIDKDTLQAQTEIAIIQEKISSLAPDLVFYEEGLTTDQSRILNKDYIHFKPTEASIHYTEQLGSIKERKRILDNLAKGIESRGLTRNDHVEILQGFKARMEQLSQEDSSTKEDYNNLSVQRFEYLSNGREDFALSILSNSEQTILPIIYGGVHKFGGKKSCGDSYPEFDIYPNKDNIYAFNKEDPQFSLIELTPYSLKRIFEKENLTQD